MLAFCALALCGVRLVLGHVVQVAPKLAIDRRRRAFQLHADLAR